MPVIDFKEIPAANIGGGRQDEFELFTRELLTIMGLNIVDGPDRGADSGRDMIAVEKRQGVMGDSEFRWLISCKHKAYSGASVSVDDEINICDRIKTHRCMGFIGVYSTIASSGLNQRLNAICNNEKFEFKIFDKEYIERVLMGNKCGIDLIKRFFPKAYSILKKKIPSNIFNEYEPLPCRACGKDLLDKNLVDKYGGIVVFVHDNDPIYENGKTKYVQIYCACKGECDAWLEQKVYAKKYSTSWNDISDLIIPTNYLKFIMSVLNRIRSGQDIYTDEAFEQLKRFILDIGQIALKEQSSKDIKRIMDLAMLPEGI